MLLSSTRPVPLVSGLPSWFIDPVPFDQQKAPHASQQLVQILSTFLSGSDSGHSAMQHIVPGRSPHMPFIISIAAQAPVLHGWIQPTPPPKEHNPYSLSPWGPAVQGKPQLPGPSSCWPRALGLSHILASPYVHFFPQTWMHLPTCWARESCLPISGYFSSPETTLKITEQDPQSISFFLPPKIESLQYSSTSYWEQVLLSLTGTELGSRHWTHNAKLLRLTPPCQLPWLNILGYYTNI